MTNQSEKLIRPLRRRRYVYYLFLILIPLGLGISVVWSLFAYGYTEQLFFALMSSFWLILAVVFLFYVRIKDMLRAEAILKLAGQHSGAMRMEWMTDELGLSEYKALGIMNSFVKKGRAVVKEPEKRWNFPTLSKQKKE